MIIDFAGQSIELTPEGAVWFPNLKLLAVADLHFEKGSFFLRASTFLPPYDSDETLEKLTRVLQRYRPKVFVAAGDSFHDKEAADRMRKGDKDRLNLLIQGLEAWYWISGNHDPAHQPLIEGLWRDEHKIDPIIFRHRTAVSDEAEISGHYHPKVRLNMRQHRLTVPCFVRTGTRLILPSFGRYTGGLDIESDDFVEICDDDREIYALHEDRVFSV